MTDSPSTPVVPPAGPVLSWWARRQVVAWLGLAASLAVTFLLVRATGGYLFRMQADRARDAMDLDRAERLYRRSHAWSPGDWRSSLGVGQVCKARAVREEDPARRAALIDEAIRWYEAGWPLNRHDLAFPYGLNHLYDMKGDQPRALRLLEDVVRRLPADDFFRTQLALQYQKMERYDAAWTNFHKAVELNPTNSLARLGLRSVEFVRPKPVPPAPAPPAPVPAPAVPAPAAAATNGAPPAAAAAPH